VDLSEMGSRVFLWVQHLLGMGHFVRAMTLANFLSADGFNVTVASGGMPVASSLADAGVKLIQLSPARAKDLEMSELIDEVGNPIDAQWRAMRTQQLASAVFAARPDIFITEAFPFGRRMLRFELLPLLERLHELKPRPKIAASLRDIMTRPRRPGRAAQMTEFARQYYDLILCHGDPRVAQLTDSFPEAAAIGGRIVNTGYVVAATPPVSANRQGVIVCAGGGAMGEKLLTAALLAHPLTKARTHPWTVIVGPLANASTTQTLSAMAPPGVSIVQSVQDLPRRFASCALAVSQGGYNTVLESLSARAPLVVVPFATEKETEQTIRARRLRDMGLIVLLEDDALSPVSFARAMDQALETKPQPVQFDLNGGPASARILRNLLAQS
jgi:predicted glycosyltransferase